MTDPTLSLTREAATVSVIETAVETATVSADPDRAGEFEALLATHVEAYRLPAGHLVHPDVAAVPDPHHVLVVVPGGAGRPYGIAAGTSLAVAFVLIMVSVPNADHFAPAVGYTMFGSSAVTSFLAIVFAAMAADRDVAASRRRTVLVPADVAAAYAAYVQTPQALRKAGAAETAVAQVEAHLPYIEDLLVEAARLHAAGVSASEEALRVRDAMVNLAANAQTLTVFAQRQHMAIEATALTTPALLMRHPDQSLFKATAEEMAQETTFVKSILTGN